MGKAQSYSKEFKLSASKLVTDLGYSYKEAAGQLGCSSWSIRQWVIKMRESGVLPPVNETASSAQELKKLRDENAQLQIENEILKKAAASLPSSQKWLGLFGPPSGIFKVDKLTDHAASERT